jgi:hypothetical protein
LAIGRVTVAFDDKPEVKSDLGAFWDSVNKIIKSSTGELTWEYNKKVVLLTAEKTQSIVGFAGGQKWSLPGVEADVTTPFVSLIFTPLDNLPLAGSRHILITAFAQDKQTGAKYSEDGKQLLDPGQPPLLLQPVQATLKFTGPKPTLVRPLDIYGVPSEQTVPIAADKSIVIDGTYKACYYELKR